MKSNRSSSRLVVRDSDKSPATSERIFSRAAVFAAVAVALVFGLYELIERNWLFDLPMAQLHRFHMLRGVLASFAAASIVGWQVFRSLQYLLADGEEGERAIDGEFLNDEEKAQRYARWFVGMRWLATLAAAALVFLTVRVWHFLPNEVWWPLLGTVAVLAATNIFFDFLQRNAMGRGYQLPGQVVSDIFLLTVLLHFSGGIENPLWLLSLFHVIIAGILLSKGQCYAVATFATSLLGGLALTEWTGHLHHYTLSIFPHEGYGHDVVVHAAHHGPYVLSRIGLLGGVLFVTAYFVTTLAERARADERALEKMAERAMAERQLLERAMETTGTGLRVVDKALAYRWLNQRWREWFLIEDADKNPSVVDSAEWDGTPAALTLQDGIVRVTEKTLLGKDVLPPGHSRTFQITSAPLRDAEGAVSQVVELAQDVTEQKSFQEQLLRAGKMAAAGELAGNVAHEVNNPIGIISAKGRLLLSDCRPEMSEKVAQEIGKITDAADRVAHIAQGLLSYCRPSGAGRQALDLRLPVERALALLYDRLKKAGVEVQEDFPSRFPFVQANANEMEQVFLNLFLNALDAMPAGGRLCVTGRAGEECTKESAESVEVEVADTGEGIPEDIRTRIFDPFYTSKEEGRGTGLGLSICLGLVRSHGGEIELRSEVGRGSAFVVRLPLVGAQSRRNQ